jgi:hypothetical protein
MDRQKSSPAVIFCHADFRAGAPVESAPGIAGHFS